MNIIVLGAPGSGKGTQANLIAKEFKLFHFDGGTLSRELAKNDARLNEIVNKAGLLIPEKEMTGYVNSYLDKNVSDFGNMVFEGYPRFVSQYKDLKARLAEKGKKIDAVIYLRVNEKKIISRLSARRIDTKTGEIYNLLTNPPPVSVDKNDLIQRVDDKAATIRERFKPFKEFVLPLIEYIRSEGNLIEVDGDRPIEEVFADIKNRLL